jgi:hypothetical protein
VWTPGQRRTPLSPLDVLLPAERSLADRYEALLARHARLHPHAIAKLKGELVVLRKQVWRAAEKGIGPDGKPTQAGWSIRNRIARYHELAHLTA